MNEIQEEQLPPKKEISAEEFIKIWKGEYKGVKGYSHYYVNNGTQVSIMGHEIIGNVEINECELYDIEINNVIFQQSITIYKSKISEIRIDNSRIHSLYLANLQSGFGNLTIEKTFINGIQIIESELSYLTCWKLEQICNITLTIATVNSIYIAESWLSNFTCNLSNIGEVDLNTCTTRSITTTQTTIKKEFIVRSKSVLGRVNISDNSHVNNLWFFESVISPFVNFSNSTIVTAFFEKDTIIGTLLIEYLNVDCITLLVDCVTISLLEINTNHPYKIIVTGETKLRSQIHQLNLNYAVFPKDLYLSISDADINEICFDSFVNNGRIVFNNVRPLNNFRKFKLGGELNEPIRTREGQYIFTQVEDASIIDIANSDLGNTQFIGCDLDLFDDFQFENSKILDLFIADTTLPQKEDINKDFPDDHEQRRLALSQFKKIYERQGDVVRATQYRAEEMEVYRAQLKDDDSDLLSKEWWNNKAERTNLWLNKFSNYYGNNWLKAVGWTLLFNSILYTFYCWAQGYWFADNWSTFWMLSAHSFEFLNPLRKADFLEHITGEHPRAGAIAIDYISRIIIAYFVYQTITAFRKFGKSSV